MDILTRIFQKISEKLVLRTLWEVPIREKQSLNSAIIQCIITLRLVFKDDTNEYEVILSHLSVIAFYSLTWCFHSQHFSFKVNNKNTRKRCEICSKITIKTLERHHRLHSGVFIVNFEQINVSWESKPIQNQFHKSIFRKRAA